MSDKIILDSLKFFAHIGCTEAERQVAQLLVFDVELSLDLKKSGISDDLSDTVDYTLVPSLIESVINARARNLIEALAEDITQTILDKFSLIDSVKLVVHKPLSGATISITRGR